MSKNWYAQAIAILESPIDYRPVVVEIAKKHPKILTDAARATGLFPQVEEQWVRECKALMRSGDKIPAIKRCRELTGWGLKESKEACESL